MPDRSLIALECRRNSLRDLRAVEHSLPEPEAGEALLAIEHVGFSANNVSYAARGEQLHFWRYFPAQDADWGRLPGWGFATVQTSRAAGLDAGERIYGYFPLASHVLVRPSDLNAGSFVDGAPHRADLEPVYNHYVRCAADRDWRRELEPLQALLKPLALQAYLLDDFLEEEQLFGAQQVLFSSPSSKSAWMTAILLAARARTRQGVRLIGMTTAGNLAHVRDLPCYDQVIVGDQIGKLARVPTLYLDFSGSAAQRIAVHGYFIDQLEYSCIIGGAQPDMMGSGQFTAGLPGAVPNHFHTAPRVAKRTQDWGLPELSARFSEAWQRIHQTVNQDRRWMQIEAVRGVSPALAALAQAIDGRFDPQRAFMIGLTA